MSKSDQIISEYVSSSVEETQNIGRRIAKNLKKGNIVAFLGNLGSGKTTLIKGLVNEINSTDIDSVSSPTFTYLNIYPGTVDVFHFDLYRIKNDEQFLSMGFDEYFEKEGICLIEWSEKITSILPPETTVIHLLEGGCENKRKIVVLEL